MQDDKNKVLILKEQKIIRFVEGVIKELYNGIPNKYKHTLNSAEIDELWDRLIKIK
ncbi:hypothetical protein [Bacillus sp. EB600]|uniref:hypothetical protein n=1 Tax=Bacillus sp. EB600 TaxID=2806345 RepID=UPI00210DD154|nr:hypothetical protein [Bacillus sp. EB600]MCQ6281053.1 hypothetical protein [Bacillus sp. EB600]